MLNIGIIAPGCVSLCVCVQDECYTSIGKTCTSDKQLAYVNKSSGK